MLLAIVLAIALNQSGDTNVVQDLKAFEQRLAATWQKGDCSAWAAMLAQDWSVIHITGEVISKDEALQMCKAPRSGDETVSIENLAVRVFNDAAVVTGHTTASDGKKASKIVLRFTDVFIRSGGAGWLWPLRRHSLSVRSREVAGSDEPALFLLVPERAGTKLVANGSALAQTQRRSSAGRRARCGSCPHRAG